MYLKDHDTKHDQYCFSGIHPLPLCMNEGQRSGKSPWRALSIFQFCIDRLPDM